MYYNIIWKKSDFIIIYMLVMLTHVGYVGHSSMSICISYMSMLEILFTSFFFEKIVNS
jgi:hypothetical protein